MATISITPVPYRRITGLDPDALWALDRAAGGLEGLSKFEDRTLLPFLLELRDKAAISAFLALPVRPEGEVRARHGVLRVWTGGPEDSQPPLPEVGIPFLAFAEPGWFDWLATDEDPRLVRFRDASKVIVLGAPVPMTLLGEVRELASLRLPEPDVPALPATREPSDAYDAVSYTHLRAHET